jgi:hypothetical protein
VEEVEIDKIEERSWRKLKDEFITDLTSVD